jgi:thioredoxin reductase (NADPH)
MMHVQVCGSLVVVRTCATTRANPKAAESEEHMMLNEPPSMQENQPDIYDIAIIGAGPTGLFGACYAGMRSMKTLILDALPEPGGQVTALYPEKYLYDVPGFPAILGRDLVQALLSQAMQFEPDLRLEERVVDLATDDQSTIMLKTERGHYQARSVLISAGVGAFAPNRLPARGAERFEGHALLYAVKEKAALAGKQVIIVGGGDSAIDWALALDGIAARVTLVHRRDQFRAHEQSIARLHASSVQLRLFCEVTELHGEQTLAAVTLANTQTHATETLPADLVLGMLGFKADAGPIKQWGLAFSQGRAIQIGPNCETSIPGVYAAGHIASSAVKLDLIAMHFGQAALAVNSAKAYIDPTASLSPGHSSERSSI